MKSLVMNRRNYHNLRHVIPHFMKHVLTIMFFFFYNFSNCQIIDKSDSLRQEITSELNEKGIGKFFFLKKTSPSPSVIEYEDNRTESYVEFTSYVFWEENSKTYVQKFDFSGKYQPKAIESFSGFQLISQNLQKMKNEFVKPYEEIIDGKQNQFVNPVQYKFNLHFNIYKVEFEHNFGEFELEKNGGFIDSDDEIKNINYISNRELKIIELFTSCNKEIQKLEKTNLQRLK